MPALQFRLPMIAAGVVTAALLGFLAAPAQAQRFQSGPMPRPPVIPPHPAGQQAQPFQSGPMPRPPVIPAHPAGQPAAAAPAPVAGGTPLPPGKLAAAPQNNPAARNAANNRFNPGMVPGAGLGFGFPNAMNPAMMSPYNPYSMGYGVGPGAPYGMPSYGGGMGYGGMGYGAPPYGSGSQSAAGSAVAGYEADRSGAQAAEEMTVSQILTASGVPNEQGRPLWPVGLRALPGHRADELRAQVDALLERASEQSAAGPVNANINKELGSALDKLNGLLARDRDERFSLPTLETYEASEKFLGKLKHAQALLAKGLEPPGEAQLQAHEGPATEVGVHDNHFDPKTLTVPAGTVVRWTNQGKHGHTVTSDKGDWGSKELGPGASFSHAFTRPGTYTYHCTIHSEEMRGTVVVK